VALDEQPVLLLLARFLRHPHKMPAAVKLLAVQFEFEVTFGIALFGVADGRPAAAVPDDHRAAAIFTFRNRSFEAAIIERMILDVDGKALVARDEARAFGYRPALQHAIHFKPQVVVQPARGVLLDNEAVTARRLLPRAPRFRRGGEIPFLAICGER